MLSTCAWCDCVTELSFFVLLQPYYQPDPAPPAPFSTNSAYHDPTFSSSQTSAWAVTISNSQDLIIFGELRFHFFLSLSTRPFTSR